MAKFKVGDEVAIAALVKITAIQPNNNDTVSYSTDRGISIHETLLDQIAIKPKEPKAEEPAPEPPKFYTGKVVCVSSDFRERIGICASITNGVCSRSGWNRMSGDPYKSIDDFNSAWNNCKFAEVKE